MSLDEFYCPVSKHPLVERQGYLVCIACGNTYPVLNGIPDFFFSEGADTAIDEPNTTWLDPQIVAARDLTYSLCARELKGMTFCMQEISKRTHSDCRILEAGVGTGHFTQWLIEISTPGTNIYAFDSSWPVLDVAKVNTRGLSGVTLLRANSREQLPFENESFDILFLRLVPLGSYGIPNIQAGYQMLKPGGWYFEAGWERTKYETPPTEWAFQHGFESAELHEFMYRRKVSPEEHQSFKIELERMAALGSQSAQKKLQVEKNTEESSNKDGLIIKTTQEYVLIAYKPD